jgi:hypothetical protein
VGYEYLLLIANAPPHGAPPLSPDARRRLPRRSHVRPGSPTRHAI